MAVAFDAVGAGNFNPSGTTTNITWSHTCTGSNRVLLVGIAVGVPGGNPFSGFTRTVTHAGTAMTSLGAVNSNNGGGGWTELFYLLNPATGAQTVSVTMSATVDTIIGNSVSYTGASGVTNFASAYGNSATLALTVTSAGTGRAIAVMCGGSTLSAVTQTQRYLTNIDNSTGASNAAIADAVGASTVSFGATVVSDWWGICGASITASSSAVTGTIGATAKKLGAAFTGYEHPKGTVAATLKKVTAAFVNELNSVRLPYAFPFALGGGSLVPYTVPFLLGSTSATATAGGHYSYVGHAKGQTFGVDTSNPATNPKLKNLEEILVHESDTLSRAIAADALADYIDFNDKTWVVTIYDFLWRPLGELGDDLMELVGTDPRNKLPTLTLKIKGDSQHIDTFKNCKTTMVGITVETGGLRLAYYVDVFDWEYKEAEWTGTATCLGIWDILNYLVIWPNFLLPIQIQIPSYALFIAPICSAIELMVAECAMRIQSGLWEFINNALSLNPDIRAWFGTLLNSNGNFFDMLKTPVYVSPINILTDTSPLIARTVRMESCGAVIQDVTRAYGVDVRVDLWLPGDEQPDEWTKTIPILTLTQPTYVVTIKDRSQITGPTGTILDSVLRTIVDLGGSFFGDIGPLIQSVPGMDNVFTSPLLGVNYVPPWAVIIAPDIGEKGSVATCKLSYHTPKGWQHIIGGRSPKWLNDLLNALFGWIVDAISILIGIVGIPSNILDGLLNNAILAFQLMEHFGRRNQVGPYHPCIEVMHPTPSAPYNIETIFGFINAYWDSRGYLSGQFTFRDGDVYKYGKDVFRGSLVTLVFDGRKKIFTDYVENVLFRYTPDARDVIVQVGDGKAEESPLAKHQRFLSGIIESINVLTFSPQS